MLEKWTSCCAIFGQTEFHLLRAQSHNLSRFPDLCPMTGQINPSWKNNGIRWRTYPIFAARLQ